MKIGYARVSRQDQNLERQVEALQREGCDVIYQEKMTGSAKHRPELDRMLKSLNADDVVIVQKLDRLGRSLSHLISLMELFKDIGVHFKSLGDSFDTSSIGGRLVFHIMAAIAEFEREMIRERTKDGLASKKANGVHLGRKFKDFSKEVEEFSQVADQEREEVMRILGVSKSKYFRLKRLLKSVKSN